MPRYRYRTLRIRTAVKIDGGRGMHRLKVFDSREPSLTWFPDQDGGDLERDHTALVEYLNSLGDEGWQIVLGQASGKDSRGMYEDGAFLLMRTE